MSATGTASASGVGLRLESVDRGVAVVESRLASLEREYSHRRGLIGAHAADVRFENAVYDFLVGDYGKACTSFYTLVESEALVGVRWKAGGYKRPFRSSQRQGATIPSVSVW